MVKDHSKSAFIFDLIEEFEIISKSGNPSIFTDETYHSFCEKYTKLSDERDSSLLQYLKSSPNLFRTHIPYSKWAFSVTFQVVWYYDELILNDPIMGLILYGKGDLEMKKNNLRNTLNYLIDHKESITGGYLLFAGKMAMPYNPESHTAISNEVINIPDVLNAFESRVEIGQKPMPINENEEDNLAQLHAKYEGLSMELSSMGVHMPPHILKSPEKLSNGLTYDLHTPFFRMSKDDLIKMGKIDFIKGMRGSYVDDISIILDALTNGENTNVPVLFYRKVDSIVAQNIAALYNDQTTVQVTNTSIYDCALPFTQGIPPERLFDVRNQIPNAFIDFRAFLYEVVTDAMKATNNQAELKFKIEQKIREKLKLLEVEMSNANTKWKLKGISSSLAMLIGSLGIYKTGVDFAALASGLIGSGAVVNGINTWSDVNSERKKSSSNPTYFLWKVKSMS